MCYNTNNYENNGRGGGGLKRIPEKTQILLARMVICGFVSGALCILMHELGHVIAALAAGARITHFNLIRGYVSTIGGKSGILVRQLFYAAGFLLPALSAAVYSLLFKRGESSAGRIFSAMYVTVCTSALLDWIVTPILWMLGKAPRGDDCTMFLECWPFHPLIVSAGVAALAVLLILLSLKRGIFSDFMETVRDHLDNGR